MVFGWTEIVDHPVSAHWWVDRLHPDDQERVHASFYAAVGNPDIEVWQDEYRFRKADGNYAIVLDRGYILRDSEGRAIRMIGAMQDITENKRAEGEIKKQLAEKEILLREVHHRVKNNIAYIEALLKLQADATENPEVKSALDNSISRIQSMHILYENLLSSNYYHDISIKSYAENLIDSLLAVYSSTAELIVDRHISDFSLSSKQAGTIGIIMNELLTNVFKYAFKNMDKCKVSITIEKSDSMITMIISDNGIGLDNGIIENKAAGFGLTIIQMLVEQLHGTFSIVNDGGTKSTVQFSV